MKNIFNQHINKNQRLSHFIKLPSLASLYSYIKPEHMNKKVRIEQFSLCLYDLQLHYFNSNVTHGNELKYILHRY